MVSMAGTETRREAGTLSVADAERLAEIMQALASPVRLRILSALSVQPSTVTDLSEQLHIGQTTTSNHLRLLRHLSLVLGTRDGRPVKIDAGTTEVLQAFAAALTGPR